MKTPLFQPVPRPVPEPEDGADKAWRAYKSNPDPAGAGLLLKELGPTLQSGIAAFGGGSGDNANMRSRARLLALESLNTYDPSRGKLRPHVMNHLRGLTRYAVKQQQVVSTPELVLLDHKRIADSTKSLADELGRDPSDAELANHTGLSLKRIGSIRNARFGLPQSQIETAMTDEEGSPGDAAVADPDPTQRLAEFIYADLDDADRLILEHRLGLRGKPKLESGEIAKKLNLSAARVSQRAHALARKLDELREAGI